MAMDAQEVLPVHDIVTNSMGRAREIRVPKWDGITNAQSWKNWKHVVFTNMHCAAAFERDATKLIGNIENSSVLDDDLRNGLSQSECSLDAELYKGISLALCSGKIDSTIALTKLRENVPIGRGMQALRMPDRDLMMESERVLTEVFSKMILL